MKTSNVILVLIAAAFVLGGAALVIGAPPAAWPTSKGEVCLEVLDGSELKGTVNMHVTRLGDGHYLVVGRNTEQTEVIPFIGSAEVVNDAGVTTIRMHATASGLTASDIHGNLTTVVLDPVTLEGWVQSLEISAEQSGSGYKVEAGPLRDLQACGQ